MVYVECGVLYFFYDPVVVVVVVAVVAVVAVVVILLVCKVLWALPKVLHLF
jgi:hypothetical protein